MGLSEKREKVLKSMPVIRTDIFRSKDGKYLIHKTSIVHIKPMNYYKAIVENTVKVSEENIVDELAEALAED
jgi:hypothetical protein